MQLQADGAPSYYNEGLDLRCSFASIHRAFFFSRILSRFLRSFFILFYFIHLTRVIDNVSCIVQWSTCLSLISVSSITIIKIIGHWLKPNWEVKEKKGQLTTSFTTHFLIVSSRMNNHFSPWTIFSCFRLHLLFYFFLFFTPFLFNFLCLDFLISP